jgi:hypothetical protein
MNQNGRGDCFICTPHPDNVNCTHYNMVHMATIEWLEDEGYFDKTPDIEDEDEEEYEWRRAGRWN